MDGLRRDAARNRDQILAVARGFVDRGEELAFNAVARAAGVGVGTVYRHFTTVEELEEVLTWDRFDELDGVLNATGTDRFGRVLTEHVSLLASDPLFERVTARSETALPQTAAKKIALIGRLAEVLGEAQRGGRIRADADAGTVLLLACGTAHSIRSAGLPPASDAAQALLDVIHRGLRP